jgi:hypothetical protein
MKCKIIRIEKINDRQQGDCIRISANIKPKGIKGLFPCPFVANSYDIDTYKLIVPNDSSFIAIAEKAQREKKYIDIDLGLFRKNKSIRMTDLIVDTANSYYSLEFYNSKTLFDTTYGVQNRIMMSSNEFYLFDIKIDNFHDGNGSVICVMASPVEYRIYENELCGYYSKEYINGITRPFIFPYSKELYTTFVNLKKKLDEEDGLWTLSYSDFTKHIYHALDGTDDSFVFYYYKEFQNIKKVLDSSIVSLSTNNIANHYYVFENLNDYDEYDIIDLNDYDKSCFTEKHHYNDKIFDLPLDYKGIPDQKDDFDDIFADYRQILFLDNNPSEQPKPYNAKITTTQNGRISQNHDINFIAKGKQDAIEKIKSELSLMEGRQITEYDFLSCVIAPL